MVVAKTRKKNTRFRAKTTHGYGSMKKNRGAGHRGGKGRAGSGKRGDVKKPSLMWKKGHKHKGRVGFKTYNQERITTINLAVIEQKIKGLVLKNKAEEKGGLFKIDLKNLKVNKLLASGKVTYKYEIVTKYASKRAIEKIEAAGGKVILPEAPVVAPSEEKEEAPAKKAGSKE